jgi:hypothetical protein
MRVLFTQADLSIFEFPPGNPSSGFPRPSLTAINLVLPNIAESE